MTRRPIALRNALLFATLLALLVAPACSGKKAGVEKSAAAKEAKVRQVETLVLKTEAFTSYVESSGSALPVRESLLSSEVPGTVEQLFVRKGDGVRKGEAILQFKLSSYQLGVEQAEAAVAAASTGASQMKLEFDRMTKLRESDAAAQANYERVKAQYDAAVAQQKLAEVGLKRAREALGNATLRAPYDGTIVATLVQLGEYAPSMPPTMLAKIVDSSSLEVQTFLPEEAAGAVKKGTKAEVEIESAALKAEGEVIFASERVDPGAQTFEVRIRLDNKDHKVKAGAFCRVRLLRERIEDALLVPVRAIARDTDGNPVVSLVRKGKVEVVPVKLGPSSGGRTQIREGLKAGDAVIVSGSSNLTPGEVVGVAGGN